VEIRISNAERRRNGRAKWGRNARYERMSVAAPLTLERRSIWGARRPREKYDPSRCILAAVSAARAARLLFVAALSPACAAVVQEPRYSASNPGQVSCGCEDGVACYQAASDLASTRGEKDSTGEQLVYLAQCACFQGSAAGCNTLSHFAKDYVAACAQDRDAATSCAIAGFVHYHGAQVPRLNRRSFDRDPAAARTEFEKACRAGSSIACSYASK